MFCEKGVRTNFANSQENACARVSFLIKLQDQAWNIIKKETLAQVFPVNFAKCLRTVFITEQNIWVSINHSMFGTAWKVFALGVILVRIFPHSDENNSEYGDSLRTFTHCWQTKYPLLFYFFISSEHGFYWSKWMFLSARKRLCYCWYGCVFEVGLSPSENVGFICFNGSLLKIIKNAFYFILKAYFVLKIFKIFVLTSLVMKESDLTRKLSISKFAVS